MERFEALCREIAASTGRTVEEESNNPEWILAHLQRRLEDGLVGGSLKKVYQQLKVWFELRRNPVPLDIDRIAKRIPAARDKQLDEAGSKMKRAPVITAATLNRLISRVLAAGRDREILALEVLIVGIVSMCRGNEILTRTKAECRIVSRDGISWMQIHAPRKTRKPRHEPSVALVPMGPLAPLRLQEIHDRA